MNMKKKRKRERERERERERWDQRAGKEKKKTPRATDRAKSKELREQPNISCHIAYCFTHVKSSSFTHASCFMLHAHIHDTIHHLPMLMRIRTKIYPTLRKH